MDDMDLGLAIDLAQDYAGRLAKAAKPFEKVADVLRAARDAQVVLNDYAGRLAGLEAEEHAARNRLQSLNLQLPLLEADVADARQHTTTTLADLTRQMTEATQAAQEVIRDAETSAAAKLAQLEADYAQRLLDVDAAIAAKRAQLEADFQARKDALEAALGGPR